MPNVASFLAEYRDRNDEDLLYLWKRRATLVAEAQEALATTLRSRGLASPDARGATAEPLQDEAVVEKSAVVSTKPMSRAMRRFLKIYGTSAPAVVMGAARLNFGALPLLLMMLAGYWFAVWWIVKTQMRPRPIDVASTVTGFFILHALLCTVVFFAATLLAGGA